VALAQSFNELRQKVAISMRVLALQGCVTDILGHVSARIPGTNDKFIRCRGENERGLLSTDTEQIRRLDFNGKGGDSAITRYPSNSLSMVKCTRHALV
jgi:ribulose-5-phosphate 4-epimerase/fuculose-1-phosphate aldolase